jgi:hypothetical protein
MPVDLWSSTPFVDEARAWVADSCRPLGITLTGEWEQPHCRPWSSAIRFASDSGQLWFKVNGPGTRHEASLVATLGRLAPGLAPDVLAADAERGWSLTRDAGPLLRTEAGPDELWPHWEALVARYAEAQIALVPHRDELLATGIRELSPRTCPVVVRELFEELEALPEDQGGLGAEQAAAVTARLPRYDEWCAELAASGVPDSIQHDDLHSANVCWPLRDGKGGDVREARIIDWGDASHGSPLGTMLATLNSVAYHAGLFSDEGTFDDRRVCRVRDAYLEPFTAFAARADLVRYVDLVRRTGCLTRALSYQAALREEPLSAHAELGFPVRDWFLGITEG